MVKYTNHYFVMLLNSRIELLLKLKCLPSAVVDKDSNIAFHGIKFSCMFSHLILHKMKFDILKQNKLF